MKFNIVIEGREDAVDFVRSRLHLFDAGLERALNFAAINLAAIAARKAPKDTGRLQASMRHYTLNRNGRILGLVRMGRGLRYAKYVEFGTESKRKRPPPPAAPGRPFHVWAERRGLNPWRVASAIGKHGLPAKPFAYPAWEEAMPYAFNAVEQVTRAVYG